MKIVDRKRARIEDELTRSQPKSTDQILKTIAERVPRTGLESLLFFTPLSEFSERLSELRQAIDEKYNSGSPDFCEQCLRFLTELVVSLPSFLPMWNLLRGESNLDHSNLPKTITQEVDESRALLNHFMKTDPRSERNLCANLRRQTERRLLAEGVESEKIEATARDMTKSLSTYVDSLNEEIARSKLRRVADMHSRGETNTEIGNDYAAFLPIALSMGASFVTTNPVLVDKAWSEFPEYWTPIIDDILKNNPPVSLEILARIVTMRVVLMNMRLLRPIFLLTRGTQGYVSLQVNPDNHNDAHLMIDDALTLYTDLERILDGGVPNVVFKLPATLSGLEACRVLTGKGIGVTITVNFGLFQEMPFAETINEGQALVSYLVEMNGRIAFPVRDELLGIADHLNHLGMDHERILTAAAWSGVAIHKRLVRLLKQRNYDSGRMKPLVASLRIYDDPAYGALPNPFIDFTETIGTGVITVFPNVRRALDNWGEIELSANRIEDSVPQDALETLRYSEIFKQGFWLPGDDTAFKPHCPLKLEQQEHVLKWQPVHNTMSEFRESFSTFKERIRQRVSAGDESVR